MVIRETVKLTDVVRKIGDDLGRVLEIDAGVQDPETGGGGLGLDQEIVEDAGLGPDRRRNPKLRG